MSEPLGRIGLALSGGGYRAAAFHLGAMDLLNRVSLLDRVRGLSTVSGGTFTGARWALALARGESFETFFAELFGYLAKTDCIRAALQRLGSPRRTPSGRQTLITAAAETYAEPAFMGAARFGEILSTQTQLDEISFNTTEFQAGYDFRFLKSRFPARVGNRFNWLTRAAAEQVRLADIVAASSCFPGGFEPIGLPDDFLWPAAPPRELGQISPGLALMDGGVYDNTGLDALLLAERRAEQSGQSAPFDVLIVSDVDQKPELEEPDAAFFRFARPEPPAGVGRLSFGTVRAVAFALAALSGASAVLLGFEAAEARGDWLRLGLNALAAGVMAAVAATPFALEWFAKRRIKGRFSADVSKLWSFIRRAPLAVTADLIDFRARSLFAMATGVFMKRIRSQQLDAVYDDESLRDRILPNFIYRLVQEDADPSHPLSPTAAQVEVARRAHAMGTQLWWDDDRQIETLIAAGQNTLCFNLLQFVSKRHSGSDLEKRLYELWGELRADPYGLSSTKARVESDRSTRAASVP